MIYVIDEYIFERKNRKIIDRGSEKTCYDCGDYVLLETGAYNKETLEQKYKDTLDVKMILNNLDVNSVEIIDCKKEKNKLYILEKKIVGDYIQKKDSESCFGNYICDYICRLNNLGKKRILKKAPLKGAFQYGGEEEIRTLGCVNITAFPMLRLRPLGHLSITEL